MEYDDDEDLVGLRKANSKYRERQIPALRYVDREAFDKALDRVEKMEPEARKQRLAELREIADGDRTGLDHDQFCEMRSLELYEHVRIKDIVTKVKGQPGKVKGRRK